jgi:hypothetical protein
MNGQYTILHKSVEDKYSVRFNDEEIVVDDGTYKLFDMICHYYWSINLR